MSRPAPWQTKLVWQHPIGRGLNAARFSLEAALQSCPTLLRVLCVFVSLWLSASPSTAELVYTADGLTVYGQVRSNAQGALVIDGGQGTPVTLQREEISAIDFRPPSWSITHPPATSVLLRNGDRLNGTLRQLWPPVVERDGEPIVVPPAWVAAVRARRSEGAEAASPGYPLAGGHDQIELANGDRIEGRIEGIREGRLRATTSIGPVSIDPARIARLILARGEAPPPAPLMPSPGIQATVETTSGERLTGEWRALTPAEIRLKPAWGAEVAIPREHASRLTVLNGRLIFLSDLHPTEVLETSYFGPPHPFQVDRSQGGRPLRLGGRIYSRGLGVHASSALTYTLAGSFKTFAATIGVDTEVGNGGSVIFRVIGDDRTLFESPVLRGGDAPLPISVSVADVLLLRLEVEGADVGDIADHADWAEARLLK